AGARAESALGDRLLQRCVRLPAVGAGAPGGWLRNARALLRHGWLLRSQGAGCAGAEGARAGPERGAETAGLAKGFTTKNTKGTKQTQRRQHGDVSWGRTKQELACGLWSVERARESTRQTRVRATRCCHRDNARPGAARWPASAAHWRPGRPADGRRCPGRGAVGFAAPNDRTLRSRDGAARRRRPPA